MDNLMLLGGLCLWRQQAFIPSSQNIQTQRTVYLSTVIMTKDHEMDPMDTQHHTKVCLLFWIAFVNLHRASYIANCSGALAQFLIYLGLFITYIYFILIYF